MASYFLDENTKDGAREVHADGCCRLPDFYHRIYLGEYSSVQQALRKAVLLHDRVYACSDCCSEKAVPQSPGPVLQAS
ncbi:hypothetical protein [Hoeflea sp. TYP-13]|uniref:hypothetical protein n=1 Tax=Hoeflea sp. TYP-13 TaxID=3230023 RepID=UPI0034C5DD1D